MTQTRVHLTIAGGDIFFQASVAAANEIGGLLEEYGCAAPRPASSTAPRQLIRPHCAPVATETPFAGFLRLHFWSCGRDGCTACATNCLPRGALHVHPKRRADLGGCVCVRAGRRSPRSERRGCPSAPSRSLGRPMRRRSSQRSW